MKTRNVFLVGIGILMIILLGFSIKRQLTIPPSTSSIYEQGKWFKLNGPEDVRIRGTKIYFLPYEKILAITGEDPDPKNEVVGVMLGFELINSSDHDELIDYYKFLFSWEGGVNGNLLGGVFEPIKGKEQQYRGADALLRPDEKKEVYVVTTYNKSVIPQDYLNKIEKLPHYLTVSLYPEYCKIRYLQ